MEYTLKGYAFDCIQTLAYAYKKQVYLGLMEGRQGQNPLNWTREIYALLPKIW